jgi:tetratricopeptide (TPR) repeat protein
VYANRFGDQELAVNSFKKAIDINAHYYEPHQKLAEMYDAQGQLDLAMKYFSEAISVYDADSKKALASLYNSRGTVFGKMKDYNKAIADFDKALSNWPNFADAYSNRAFAKFNLGLYNQADADCNMALQIDPGLRKAQTIKEMIKQKSM